MNPIAHINETAFCMKHPTGYISRDRYGTWYSKCYTGHKFNEECEIIIEKVGEKK